MTRQVVFIARDTCFSAQSVEKDRAIYQAVAQRLAQRGYEVTRITEDADAAALRQLGLTHDVLWLTMGRHRATLDYLRSQEQQGMRVVNSTQGVWLCQQRDRLEALMRRNGIPAPPLPGDDMPAEGVWVKRADSTSQGPDDVVFAANREQREQALNRFRQRGITQVVVGTHVRGDVVKFYGVQPGGFFRTFYPTDDGDTKYGDERRNGPAQHYAYDVQRLQTEAQRLSALTGVTVYGGDAIIRSDGSFCIIDFNDWPSFARCRDEAAEAVALSIEH